MPGLGLGLGLNQGQQQAWTKAAQAGQGAQWLGEHERIGRRVNRRIEAGTPAETKLQNFIATGQPQRGQGGTPQPPQGSPTTGTGKGAAPGPAGAVPAPAPPPGPAPNPNTYQGALNTQYGAGQPFGMQDWYGGNPLETARDLANRNLDKNLAGIRARYAGSGGGTSGREAIAEGTAAGEAATGLGDVMAQRGLQARQADVTAGLQAMLGAGQQGLQGQQIQMQYGNQMGQLGSLLNQIGAMEQGVPNAGMIEQLLGLFSQSTGESRTRQKQQTQSGFLGM